MYVIKNKKSCISRIERLNGSVLLKREIIQTVLQPLKKPRTIHVADRITCGSNKRTRLRQIKTQTENQINEVTVRTSRCYDGHTHMSIS